MGPPRDGSAAIPSTPYGGWSRRAAGIGASRVPQLTAWFWVVKLLTTGMGETTWDFSAVALGPVPAVVLSGSGFVVALSIQLRSGVYRPWVYWFAVLMVSVFGTTAADAVHVVLGVPYAVSSVAFLVAVLATFALWRRVEGTLSMHSIRTPRREIFYWSAVVLTFALGTAAGDLTATTLGLGYPGSTALFAVLFAVPALLAWRGKGDVAAFWVAYVFTRPLGASAADWLGVSPARGGVGVGTGPVSLVALLGIAAVVAYLSISGVDREETAPVVYP